MEAEEEEETRPQRITRAKEKRRGVHGLGRVGQESYDGRSREFGKCAIDAGRVFRPHAYSSNVPSCLSSNSAKRSRFRWICQEPGLAIACILCAFRHLSHVNPFCAPCPSFTPNQLSTVSCRASLNLTDTLPHGCGPWLALYLPTTLGLIPHYTPPSSRRSCAQYGILH